MERKAASGIMVTMLLIGMLTLASNIQQVNAGGTIYIRADGSIDPPTANITTLDNVTYTFTGNMSDSIVIERGNIVVDGLGYTVQGGKSGIGILVSYSLNVTIKSVVVRDFDFGIRLNHSPNNTVIESFVTENNYGVLSDQSDFSTIANNNASANEGWGIVLYSNYNHVIGNIVSYNHEGIHVYISNNTVSLNDVHNNTHGIHLENDIDNTITCNRLSNNEEGIWLANASGDQIFHNDFINNIRQVSGGSEWLNAWDNGYPSGGNYWSNYNGIDANQDGIGDTPYIINENNQDNYPLMNHWAPDVAVIDVTPSKTIIANNVGNGTLVRINITVTNQGNKIEGFEVQAYAGMASISLQNVVLTSGSSRTLNVTWNTTGFAKGV